MLRIGLMALFAITVIVLNYRVLFNSKRVQQARGSIELIDVSSRVLVVRTDDASRRHSFVWDGQTGFFNIDGAIAPQATALGQRVSVVYATLRGSKWLPGLKSNPFTTARPEFE